jgi:glucose-6-phosphate 1-dehydrogenase
MDSRHIHREKEALLSRIQPPTPDKMAERTVRGQYRSYRDETGIPDSKTDTYAALWLEIDTETWRDVPVLIRTGKALARKVTEITLIFADEAPGSANRTGRRNCLTLRIQPDEGIAVDFAIRKPGFEDTVEQVQLDYCYRGLEEPVRSDAYRRVLFDALRGDATLFATDREVLECWRISEPVLNAWKEDRVPLEFYDNGAAGPAGADELAGRAGTEWLPETHTVCRFPQRR